MERLEMSADLLVGAASIADFLGVRRRQVYHASEHSYLPLFRVGALICGRRSTLEKWVTDQEQMAFGASDRTGQSDA